MADPNHRKDDVSNDVIIHNLSGYISQKLREIADWEPVGKWHSGVERSPYRYR